jgi:hypothetical protein
MNGARAHRDFCQTQIRQSSCNKHEEKTNNEKGKKPTSSGKRTGEFALG